MSRSASEKPTPRIIMSLSTSGKCRNFQNKAKPLLGWPSHHKLGAKLSVERCLSANLWATLRLDNYVVYILCGVPPLGKGVFGVLWQNQCVDGNVSGAILYHKRLRQWNRAESFAIYYAIAWWNAHSFCEGRVDSL